MTRTRTGSGFHDLRVGSEGSLRGIEGIDQQMIESKVGGHGKAIVRRERDRVGVRSRLPLRIYARAFVLHERRSFPQSSVLQHREHGHASRGVVGNQGVPPRPVKSDMSWGRSSRRDLVQERKLPGFGLNGKCAHRACRLAIEDIRLVDCIEESSAGTGGEKRWLHGLGGKTERGHLARRGIETVDIDSFAAMVGIGANVDKILSLRGSGGRREHGRSKRDQQKSGGAENSSKMWHSYSHTILSDHFQRPLLSLPL